jgi:hypothetical protein
MILVNDMKGRLYHFLGTLSILERFIHISIALLGFSIFVESLQGIAWKILFFVSLATVIVNKKVLFFKYDWLVFSVIILININTYIENGISEFLASIKILVFFFIGLFLREKWSKNCGKVFFISMFLGLIVSTFVSVWYLCNGDLELALMDSSTIFRLKLPPGPSSSTFYCFALFIYFSSKEYTSNNFLNVGVIFFFSALFLLINLKSALVGLLLLLVVSVALRLFRIAGNLACSIVLISVVALTAQVKLNDRLMFSGAKNLFAKMDIATEPLLNFSLAVEENSLSLGKRKLIADALSIENSMSNGRFLFWAVALNGIAEKPLLGHGRRSFRLKYLKLKKDFFDMTGDKYLSYFAKGYVDSKETTRSTHNFALGLLFEFGVVGFILFACLGYIALKRSYPGVLLGNSSFVFSWGLALVVYPVGHYFIFRPVVEIMLMIVVINLYLSKSKNNILLIKESK